MGTPLEKSTPQRKSPRLQGYNYGTPGAYFVTICTHQRLHCFGEIKDGIMRLNDLGKMADNGWRDVPSHYREAVDIEVFVVMPNHVHAVIILHDVSHRPQLATVVSAYKAGVTRRSQQRPLWQGRYHDHIIRDEAALDHIRDYVIHNPERWELDTFFKSE